MTLRNSFRKRPPFPFSHRARVNQLVCDPRPYVRAWAEDGRPLWAPCLAWAPGPQELGVTGDGEYGTLFGANWLAQICQDGTWVLYKRIGNETLEVVPWDVEPPTVAITARHPTLAFDQAARPAIAWEDGDGVRLREYNEVTQSYHFVGPFEGRDPVLLADATINAYVPGSDVILFYLSADRTKLNYRIQSENFAVEHEHYDFGEAVVLDAHDTGGWRYQLKYGDGHGSVLGPITGGFTALVSRLYPVFVSDDLAAQAQALVGEYERGALRHDPIETVDVDAAAVQGAYLPSTLRITPIETVDVDAAAVQGAYALGAWRYDPVEAVDVSGVAEEGLYAIGAIRRGEADAAVVTATALEGAYSPA